MRTSRREFLGTLAVGAAAGVLESGCRSACLSGWCADPIDPAPSKDFCFTGPFDGGIIHEQCGTPVLGIETGSDGARMLKIEVSGVVPPGVKPELFTADGRAIPVTLQNGVFRGAALLRDRVTEIRARAVIGGKRRVIRTRPVWVKNSTPRFRCYIDDHSFSFRDIARQRYKSIFDCFYLGKLRDLNRNFGVKINLNCFNTTPERDFSLSMFPDTYKSEFEDNAHWLRLAFHSENEFPDIPYLNATPEKLAADFDLVAGELKRIAGSAYTAGLQIHWADVPPDCYQVLADRGVKMLPTRGRKPDAKERKICDYHLPDAILEYLCDHQGWMHFESGLIFYSAATGTRESIPLDKTVPSLLERIQNPAKNHLLNIAGHEQYWWPFYKNFVPNLYERYAAAFRFVLDRGYRPIWIEDGFFGGAG
ncbi:MAG: twin-arginine translocation signal domain-containing protein [Kiritimatiellae bacterium]|nr:twin-arginine translocation signal domain-containing protein [Kiritimatiellia bacterium]